MKRALDAAIFDSNNQEPGLKQAKFESDEFEDYGDAFWIEVISSMEKNGPTTNAKTVQIVTHNGDGVDSVADDDNDGTFEHYEYPNFDVDPKYEPDCKSIFRTLQSMNTVPMDDLSLCLISEYAASVTLIQICNDCSKRNAYNSPSESSPSWSLSRSSKWEVIDGDGDRCDVLPVCNDCAEKRRCACGRIGFYVEEYEEWILSDEHEWSDGDYMAVILICKCGDTKVCSSCCLAADAMGESWMYSSLQCCNEDCGDCLSWS